MSEPVRAHFTIASSDVTMNPRSESPPAAVSLASHGLWLGCALGCMRTLFGLPSSLLEQRRAQARGSLAQGPTRSIGLVPLPHETQMKANPK
jgi:hypothetical protein